jgi:hypothetical protein
MVNVRERTRGRKTLYVLRQCLGGLVLLCGLPAIILFLIEYRAPEAERFASFRPDSRFVADLKSDDPSVRYFAVKTLLERDNPAPNQPATVDWAVQTLSAEMGRDGEWTDRDRARKFYELVKGLDSGLVVEALVRAYRTGEATRHLPLLFVGGRLGIPGSQEKFVDLLREAGDRQMAEDYLNSGAPVLQQGARQWAQEHGYSIEAGTGSDRMAWGYF